ncbi:MAG: asparagine synthase (glutamine-hydrolyzing) [Alphaproteobacteria bacterium]|jgi:asparagine synthase (glutamine-hydrolysing)|nr:asparagine synthase (glutamine-hydrolyzing) [Alphaproteobacteria bacterium]MBT5389754.1 asparagine synthase (glutamine-hydrolyzing) [Alphaproteobacteria bacterium]MBT5540819.1 asparagine synthase (glutamine-hydrolyzing) [Alphaproteobacteria bacterium]MBT5655083.1 asparagine synthase (glutamine-hydrolyzing) [Alphaproteobacteria bacterium]
MCGFAGFFDFQKSLRTQEYAFVVDKMATTLTHRGPDDSGVWVDESKGIALGFRRLSIMDLSVEGHQPMLSKDGRYVIVFNGEIYNFKALRQQLDQERKIPWNGHSDTEVLVESVAHWGFHKTLEALEGMFSIALWDRKEESLSLARDRFGEKPLYYGWMGNVFLFGSELKALVQHPSWKGEVDRDSLGQFLRYGYIPAPKSIFQGINKLLPGRFLTLSPRDFQTRTEHIALYWKASDKAADSKKNPWGGSIPEAVDALENALEKSVAQRLHADVPLGAFLSGGIDSSMVVALMQKKASKPIQTYTIGFEDRRFNEAHQAKQVAEHLGTDHTEVYVNESHILEQIRNLPLVYDEPFADVSQLPTCLLTQITRQHVKVALSGDGGDEFFGGYPRYEKAFQDWKGISSFPDSVRTLMKKMPVQLIANCLNQAGGLKKRPSRPGDKLLKLSKKWACQTPQEVYERYQAPGALFGQVAAGESLDSTAFTQEACSAHGMASLPEQFMFLDSQIYLPDDLEVKMDRASMSVGLEVRAPFLDHNLAELSWRMPWEWKSHPSEGAKWILRQALYRYVPSELVDRPKQGFEVPIGDWLRKGLRSWADDLLNSNQMKTQGFLNQEYILKLWDAHQRGRNLHNILWPVLVFQQWASQWLGEKIVD